MRPTESDWDMMVFCQKIAHAVRKSDNLKLPSDPNKALNDMKRCLLDLYPQGRLF